MHELIRANLFLVKEHVGVFKAANNFDIFDPATEQLIMECREDKLGLLTQVLRFTDYKRNTPFDVQIRTPDGRQVVRVSRGISVFLSTVEVHDDSDRVVGRFKQKLFSVGGSFDVLDVEDRVVCSLVGKWTGWDFRFLSGNRELAHVSKRWAGVGKELFTTADNYVLEINEQVSPDDPVRQLILGAVMCIDMGLKE